jgi:hypothetical protein
MKKKDLPKPDKETVEKYLALFQKADKARDYDKVISNVIQSFPLNDNLESVILKISVINDLYSTNIFSVYELAKHIITQNFDEAIREKDYGIVNRIALGHGIESSRTGKGYNFYSFATKYCSWHDQYNFPIFDRYIDFVLKEYNTENDYVSDHNFRKYENLVEALTIFRIKHNLERYSLKEIDKFLWLLGQEILNPKTETK